MANVTIIPARRQVNNVKQAEQPKLRVAAYCRVSTDSDEQETSYETQVSHYGVHQKPPGMGACRNLRRRWNQRHKHEEA